MGRISIVCIVISFIALNMGYSEGGKYAGEFLNIGAGVRATGMGSAFTGISDDSTAAYWNPAGLSQLKKGEFTLMYSNMFEGIVKYGFANITTPKLKGIPGSFGLSVISLSVPDVPYLPQTADNDTLVNELASYPENVNTLYNKTTYDTDQETAILLSYSFPKGVFDNKLFVGMTFKSISQKVFEYSSNGFGIDLGLLYTGLMSNGLKIGLNIQDITNTPISWNTGVTDNIPLSMKFGIGYTTTKIPIASSASFGLDLDTKYGSNTNIGTELWFADFVAVRLGYRQLGGPVKTLNNLTAGLGFKLFESYRFDYALMTHDDLGNTQRASFSMKF